MTKYVVAESLEAFENAKNERGEEFDDAVYLDDPNKLAGVEPSECEIVILPGAEELPIVQNWRVQRLLKGETKDDTQGEVEKSEGEKDPETNEYGERTTAPGVAEDKKPE